MQGPLPAVAEADAELRLEIVGERVIVNAGQNRRFPIWQISESRFVMPGGATLEIQRGAEGEIRGLEYSSSRVTDLPFVRRAQ